MITPIQHNTMVSKGAKRILRRSHQRWPCSGYGERSRTTRRTIGSKAFSCLLAFAFIFSSIVPPQGAYAQTVLNLPIPGAMVPLSPAYSPAMIKGINIDPTNPLQMDFIIDSGDTHFKGEEFNNEATKLIKYFLSSLTLKEEEMWVNLSPYEKDRMIPEAFSQTEMGRDLLIQDYLLKQLTASLIYPEDDLGKKFWDRVYTKAQEQFGTTEIPMNTFNKIWIIPESAQVFEHDKGAFVVSSHLKVMLEEDYLALEHHDQKLKKEKAIIDARSLMLDASAQNPVSSIQHPASSIQAQDTLSKEIVSGVSLEIIRATELSKSSFGKSSVPETIFNKIVSEILIPEIEKEVNAGQTFTNLRQIFNSMILATWYKQNLKESLLSQVYVNQNKLKGIELDDPSINNRIYDQYVEAFKKGVYNYIKEDIDPNTQEMIPRKYFSGGFASSPLSQVVDKGTTGVSPVKPKELVKKGRIVSIELDALGAGTKQFVQRLSEYEDTVSSSPVKYKKRIISDVLKKAIRESNGHEIAVKKRTVNKIVRLLAQKEILRKIELRKGLKEILREADVPKHGKVVHRFLRLMNEFPDSKNKPSKWKRRVKEGLIVGALATGLTIGGFYSWMRWGYDISPKHFVTFSDPAPVVEYENLQLLFNGVIFDSNQNIEERIARVGEAHRMQTATRAFWLEIFSGYPDDAPVSAIITLEIIRASWENRQLDDLFNALRTNPDLLYRYLSEISDSQMLEFSRYFATLKPGTRQQVFEIFYKRLRNDFMVLENGEFAKSVFTSTNYRLLSEQTHRMQNLYAKMAQMLNRILPAGTDVERLDRWGLTKVMVGAPLRLKGLPQGPVAPLPIMAMTRKQSVDRFYETLTSIFDQFKNEGYQVVMPNGNNVNTPELAAFVGYKTFETGHELWSSFLEDNQASALTKWVLEITDPFNPQAHRVTEGELIKKAMELHKDEETKRVNFFKAARTVGKYYVAMARNPLITMRGLEARANQDGINYLWERHDPMWLMWSLDPNTEYTVDDVGRPVLHWRPVDVNGNDSIPEDQRTGILRYTTEDVSYHAWNMIPVSFYIEMKSLSQLEQDFLEARNKYGRDDVREDATQWSGILETGRMILTDDYDYMPLVSHDIIKLPYYQKLAQEMGIYTFTMEALSFSATQTNSGEERAKTVLVQVSQRLYQDLVPSQMIKLEDMDITIRTHVSQRSIGGGITLEEYERELDKLIETLMADFSDPNLEGKLVGVGRGLTQVEILKEVGWEKSLDDYMGEIERIRFTNSVPLLEKLFTNPKFLTAFSDEILEEKAVRSILLLSYEEQMHWGHITKSRFLLDVFERHFNNLFIGNQHRTPQELHEILVSNPTYDTKMTLARHPNISLASLLWMDHHTEVFTNKGGDLNYKITEAMYRKVGSLGTALSNLTGKSIYSEWQKTQVDQEENHYQFRWKEAYSESGSRYKGADDAFHQAVQVLYEAEPILREARQKIQNQLSVADFEITGDILRDVKFLVRLVEKLIADQAEGEKQETVVTSSPVKDKDVGGIDFNPNNLDLQTKGKRFNFKVPFDSIDLQNIRIDGFTPVIINVTPLINLLPLLGLIDEESDTPKNANHTHERDPVNHKEENYLKVSSLN